MNEYTVPGASYAIFDWALLPDGSGLIGDRDAFDFICECIVEFPVPVFSSLGSSSGMARHVAVAKAPAS